MNAVQSNTTPRNIMLVVTTEVKADPLGIHMNPEGSKWEANVLTSLIATRIVALGNRMDGLLIQGLSKEALFISRDMQDLAGVIRDMQQWPFIHGQEFIFKYGGVFYCVNALEPNKVEEIERAKDYYLKSAQIKKDS